jgi:hypothetical protein
MKKTFKLVTFSAILFASSQCFSADLSKEKLIICAGFYHNVGALSEVHGDKLMGFRHFKYMLEADEKYFKKMKVTEETLNSATTRAKDVELALVQLYFEEMKSKYPNASGEEAGALLLKFFKMREKKLGC